MFFKRHLMAHKYIAALTTLFVSLVGFFAGGCSGNLLNDSPPQLNSFNQVGGFQPDCLRNFPTQVSDYFSGQLQEDNQIDGMWNCAGSSLQFFTQMTKGSRPDIYLGSELQNFVNRFLPEDRRISDGLRREAMKLKVALFGGNDIEITRDEVSQVISFLNIIRDASIRVKRLMPLNGTQAAQLSEEELNSGIEAMQSFTQEAGHFFSTHGRAYAFDDVVRLLQEFENVYIPASTPGGGIRFLREQMPFLRFVKSAIIGRSSDRIDRDEWESFLTFGARLHGIFFYYSKISALHSHDWLSNAALTALEALISRGTDMLSDAAALHENGQIPRETVLSTIEVLRRLKQTPGLETARTTELIADATAKVLLFKQILMGGDYLTIDLRDAPRLLSLYQNLKQPGSFLYKLFFQFDIPGMGADEFNKNLRILDQYIPTVADAIENIRREKNPSENFSNIDALLLMTSSLFEKQEFADSFRHNLQGAKGLKAALLGPPYDVVGPGEWRKLIKQSLRIARVYLMSKRPIPSLPGNIVSQNELDHWWSMTHAVFDILLDALRERPASQSLQTSEIIMLIDSLASDLAQWILPKSATVEDVKRLIPDIMTIKQALVGGSDQAITAEELQRLIVIAEVIKNEYRRLLPYFPVDLHQIASWDQSRMEGFATILEEMGQHIGVAIAQGTPGVYAVSQLESVLTKLRPFFRRETLDQVREFLPIAVAAKSIIYKPHGDRILAEDWSPLLTMTGRWLGTGIRAHHFMKQEGSWFRGVRQTRLVNIFNRIFDLLGFAATSHTLPGQVTNHGEISFAEIDTLVDVLSPWAERHEIKLPFTPQTTKDVLRPVVRRLLFGLERFNTTRTINGLNSLAIELSRRRIQEWARGQEYLQQIYANLGGETAFESDGYRREQLLREINRLDGTDPVVRSLRSLVTTFRPFFLGQEGHASFRYDGVRDQLYSFYNLSLLNIFYKMVQTLIEGYADDPIRARNVIAGVNSREFVSFYVDAYNVILEMRPGYRQSAQALGQQRFTEANIFMSVSDGNEYFGLYEGIEYLVFVATTGIASTNVYNDIKANCPLGDVTFGDFPTIQAACYRNRFFNVWNMERYYSNVMPRLVTAYDSLERGMRQKFMHNLEIIARSVGVSDRPVDVTENDSFTMILLYIESIFARYDVRHHNTLTLRESMAAFPIVCRKIKEASRMGGNCDHPGWSEVEALFGYLILHGAAPRRPAGSIWEQIGAAIDWLGWMVQWGLVRNDMDNSVYRVFTRERLLSVMGALVTTQPPSTEPMAINQ